MPTLKRRKSRKPPDRYDPSRTGILRRALEREIKRRFTKLKLEIVKLFTVEDAFGYKVKIATAPVRNARWAMEEDDEQVKQFRQWIRLQAAAIIIGASMEDLWKRFLLEAYRKGAGRSFDDSKERKEFDRDTFLKTSFGQRTAPEKVRLIATRSFSDLEGITEAMSTKMVQILAKGFENGENPRNIAREMAKQVDVGVQRATTIARTEVIKAHAQGQLNAMRAMGVEKVGVMVEWSTAGDDRVCDLCASMDGTIYTIDEAEGKIPAHPNCRCAFIPANVGEAAPVGNSLLRFERLYNAFCATGPGGGVDPTCGKGDGGGGGGKAVVASKGGKSQDLAPVIAPLKKHELDKLSPADRNRFNVLRKRSIALNDKARRLKGRYDPAERAKDQADADRYRREQLEIRDRARALVNPEELQKFKAEQIAKAKNAEALKMEWQPAQVQQMPQQAPAKGKLGTVTPADDPIGSSMQSNEVKSAKYLGGGVNNTMKVTLADGTKGVWKPLDGEAKGMRVNVPDGTGYKREAAAYSVAKEIGLTDLVPVTVEREVDGRIGSIQKWADGATVAANVYANSTRFDGDKDLARAAAFDLLIGNTDRHSGNWMAKFDAEKNNIFERNITSKLVLIDNGLAFPTAKGGFRSYLAKEAGNRGLKIPEEVKSWDANKIKAALEKHGLEESTVKLTLRRLEKIKDLVGQEIPYGV